MEYVARCPLVEFLTLVCDKKEIPLQMFEEQEIATNAADKRNVENVVSIVMEYVAGCSLVEFLTMVCDNKEIPLQILEEQEIATILKGLLNAPEEARREAYDEIVDIWSFVITAIVCSYSTEKKSYVIRLIDIMH